MVTVLNREQSRAVDKIATDEFGIPSIVLMENAGRGVVDVLMSLESKLGKVAIICGKGNNGGDGYVVARHLLIHGYHPTVVLLASPDELSGDAKINYEILTHCDLTIHDFSAREDLLDRLTEKLADADWLVDGLLGTGAKGEPREPSRTAIEWMNHQAARRLAIDVPSGLDCDTGEAAEVCFRADHTCTFATTKIGYTKPTAAEFLGQLHVITIGTPPALIDKVGGM